jgi:hypothetical protein
MRIRRIPANAVQPVKKICRIQQARVVGKRIAPQLPQKKKKPLEPGKGRIIDIEA